MNQANDIPLDHAKKIIVTALDAFDPELGVRAAEILFNDDRANIIKVRDKKPEMMQCRPAGITIEDLKAMNMHIPDFSQKFGPHFERQDNPCDFAIIDLEYDGSPQSLVMLAHELGHAIADDVQRENGRSFRDFAVGEMEEQAYFIQHIVSHAIKDDPNNAGFIKEALQQNTLKMSWERATQFTNAGNVFEDALAEAPDKRKQTILNALGHKTP